jgi:hypothetical protein
MAATTTGSMVSATVGSAGATSAQIPASWWVRNDFSEMVSRCGVWAASWMVREGNRRSITATSPKWRSRSTRATSVPVAARATARLVDRKVLPQPPLELNTVMTLPGARSSPASVGTPPASRPRRVLAISSALAAAARVVAASPVAARTSLTPTRRAWRSSSPVSCWRISSTDTSGAPCCSRPARASASLSDRVGPTSAASTAPPSAATAAIASSGPATRTARPVSPARAVASQVA